MRLFLGNSVQLVMVVYLFRGGWLFLDQMVPWLVKDLFPAFGLAASFVPFVDGHDSCCKGLRLGLMGLLLFEGLCTLVLEQVVVLHLVLLWCMLHGYLPNC